MKLKAIMPTYNQIKYLKEAVDSVINQVDELIVVDDCSTDGTAKWLEDNNIPTITHSTNCGTAQAINTGWACLSDSDWLTWVSSDNVYYPNWASTLLAEANSNTGAVYSAYYRWSGDYKKYHKRPYDPEALLAKRICYFGPSFIIHNDVWKNAGEHRGLISHDYDHWLRVEEYCWKANLDILYVPEPLCDYRVHSERVTITRKHQYDAPRWTEEALKRRDV